MIVGFVIAKFIAPNDLGLWATINLALTYSVFLQAGLINGLNLELPFAYGKGDDEEAKNMAGTVQTFTFFSSVLVLIAGIVVFSLANTQGEKIRFGILAVTIIISFSYYQNYLLSTFRSKNSFSKLSIIQFADAFVNILTLFFVAYYSFYGMLIKAVIVAANYVFLLHLTRPIKVKLIWKNSAIIRLLKIGLPIWGLVYLDSFSSTVDKLWLLKYTDFTNVGLYSFGLYTLTTFSLLSQSIASYIYPRMTYNYGKNNDKRILWNYVKSITKVLFIGQMGLAVLGYFVIPHLVAAYFPNYILSISAMQILLFAGVFKGSVIGVNALWSIKDWKYMITYQVIYSVLLIGLPFIGIHLMANKIIGVAFGVLSANFLNLISGLYLTYKATSEVKSNIACENLLQSQASK
ncbi:MAG: lipopolysaccharide biosynthesis protein [Syntrophothermus sp.]